MYEILPTSHVASKPDASIKTSTIDRFLLLAFTVIGTNNIGPITTFQDLQSAKGADLPKKKG